MNLDPTAIDDPWSAIAFVALIGYLVVVTWRSSRHAKATRRTLEHEVRPNSGSSLRDAVDRIDKRLADVEAYHARRRWWQRR
ncbi:hypothetical protein CWIS_09765 [Cellulomonas sp. A375-1]|uniref:DUF948 domain-containing protein n=1 Tax=Cellulomonas sp. A375-1 TaxID=1672219 RepID=UPI0006527EF1|nr:DUF948 domain-containing protein [Cellulomonas sp. A375-1]KMM45616.1 hypothetical protein CWIS_09765 [Cellulomonas sp. A375-1]